MEINWKVYNPSNLIWRGMNCVGSNNIMKRVNFAQIYLRKEWNVNKKLKNMKENKETFTKNYIYQRK